MPKPAVDEIGQQINVLNVIELVSPRYANIQLYFQCQMMSPSLFVFTNRFFTSDTGTQYHGIMDEYESLNSFNDDVSIVLGRSP